MGLSHKLLSFIKDTCKLYNFQNCKISTCKFQLKTVNFLVLLLCAQHCSEGFHILTQLILRATAHEVGSVAFSVLSKRKLIHGDMISFSEGLREPTIPTSLQLKILNRVIPNHLSLRKKPKPGNIFEAFYFYSHILLVLQVRQLSDYKGKSSLEKNTFNIQSHTILSWQKQGIGPRLSHSPHS